VEKVQVEGGWAGSSSTQDAIEEIKYDVLLLILIGDYSVLLDQFGDEILLLSEPNCSVEECCVGVAVLQETDA
jgi:hypothetical protein